MGWACSGEAGTGLLPSSWFFLQKIAQEVSEQHLSQGRLYPPLSTIRDVSLRIAIKVRRIRPPIIRAVGLICDVRRAERVAAGAAS